MSRVRAHARITGTVQGVGFRWFARNQASRHNLTGWVRNRSDGSVELEVEGPRGTVEEYLDYMREGPRFSEVADMAVTWTDVRHDSTFEVIG